MYHIVACPRRQHTLARVKLANYFLHLPDGFAAAQVVNSPLKREERYKPHVRRRAHHVVCSATHLVAGIGAQPAKETTRTHTPCTTPYHFLNNQLRVAYIHNGIITWYGIPFYHQTRPDNSVCSVPPVPSAFPCGRCRPCRDSAAEWSGRG